MASSNILASASHTFANNPLIRFDSDQVKPSLALEFLHKAISPDETPISPQLSIKVLPFSNGCPLVRSSFGPVGGDSNAPPIWYLGWLLPSEFAGISVSEESFVYLGSMSKEDVDCGTSSISINWAIDISNQNLGFFLQQPLTNAGVPPKDPSSFVDLRTLMIATDWSDQNTVTQLAIAGQAKALLEWHRTSRYCGHCGSITKSIDAGRRKQCTQESCKKRLYPRVDPVVIMLVIDEHNDRALLSRQSRFVPRMWSCLSGFLEPGESLEEAVKRETLEETGVQVREVVYHSSQPWPVGPSSMPCQLMLGFFAYAESFDIKVDKTELEDAQWYTREEVKKGLAFAEYAKAQRTSVFKVNQMCQGIPKDQRTVPSDFTMEKGEIASMVIPGPFAIAHHLISSWANNGNRTYTSISNL